MSETTLSTIVLAGGGSGPPLVLLHAFPLDHRMWIPCARILAPHVSQIVLLDLPGHGQSAVPDTVGLEVSADAVARALAELGLDRVVLAGLSMGGYVALAFADRHGGLLAGLALVDSKTTPDDAVGAAKRHDLVAALASEGLAAALPMIPGLLAPVADGEVAAHAAQVSEWLCEQNPDGVTWSALAMAQRTDRSFVVTDAVFPVSFISGSEDAITPLNQAEQAFGGLEHVSLASIEGAGHLSALEDPSAVAAELLSLLNRVRLAPKQH